MAHFDPYDLATAVDPYPIYAELRESAPVYRNEERKFWALSRHADVVAAHNDWETYTSTGGVTIEGHESGGGLLITQDPPRHHWHRKIVSRVFTPRRMLELEPFVRSRAAELLDAHTDLDEFDVVREFSIRLPLDVISELLGIPEVHRSDVNRWSDQFLARGPDADMDKVLEAGLNLHALYLSLVEDRRRNPSTDVISLIMKTDVVDDDGVTHTLTDSEIAQRFLEMGAAGHETVAKGIPNGLMALTRFPDQRRALLNDRSLLPKAVEETLRYDAPSQLQGRTTTRDVELHGTTIPAGERVMLITGSALRDDRVYDQPDRFDLNRTQDPSTLFFGFGIHRCLGAHLARMEMRVAFDEILSRFPDFDVDESRAHRHVVSNVRGVSTLPFRPSPSRQPDAV
ncbi:cytochrome P450 [Frankia sp. Cpl3]|uniref:cytochrome P450 n=1 Tax=Parafrankia colletiae TaxID=573497 RepID=UPI000AB2DD93|nr:cytochrome P450 [Parafrankia colletiae]MCK9902066.1 cytochrome P450 [Frankia sp. Cpl3]